MSLANTNVDPEVGNWGGSVTQREAGIEWLQAELVRRSKVSAEALPLVEDNDSERFHKHRGEREAGGGRG